MRDLLKLLIGLAICGASAGLSVAFPTWAWVSGWIGAYCYWHLTASAWMASEGCTYGLPTPTRPAPAMPECKPPMRNPPPITTDDRLIALIEEEVRRQLPSNGRST